MIAPLQQALRIADKNGEISAFFHRWLQQLALIATTEQSPVIGDQAPGSFVVGDGQYLIHVKRLAIGSGEHATVEGSARVVVCG